MYKKILLLFIASSLVTSAWAQASGERAEGSAFVEMAAQEPVLTIKGESARVQYGQGETLEVFSLTGVKVLSVKIETNDHTVGLNLSRGIYIFRIGKVVRKVSIS